MKIWISSLGLFLSACLPGAVISQFPQDPVSGQAFYTGLALDSGHYFAPNSLIPIRVQGLRGLSPCLLQKPSLNWQGDQAKLDWPINGALNSACAFPAIQADTTLWLSSQGAPADFALMASKGVSRGDSVIYSWTAVDTVHLRQGQAYTQLLNFESDSSGNWKSLPDSVKLVKVLRQKTQAAWLRTKIRVCSDAKASSCSVPWVRETWDEWKVTPDTTVLDTLERISNDYCPTNGQNRCQIELKDSILSSAYDAQAEFHWYQPLLLVKSSACIDWNRSPVWTTALKHDFRLSRFTTQKAQVQLYLYRTESCLKQTLLGFELDSNRRANNPLESLWP